MVCSANVNKPGCHSGAIKTCLRKDVSGPEHVGAAVIYTTDTGPVCHIVVHLVHSFHWYQFIRLGSAIARGRYS